MKRERQKKVNGQLSQTCYLRALDSCYDRLAAKKTAAAAQAAAAAEAGVSGGGGEGRPFVLSDVEHVLCHSPYNKLVQKSFARMAFSDARRLRGQGKPLGEGQEEALGKWLDAPAEVCGRSGGGCFFVGSSVCHGVCVVNNASAVVVMG